MRVTPEASTLHMGVMVNKFGRVPKQVLSVPSQQHISKGWRLSLSKLYVSIIFFVLLSFLGRPIRRIFYAAVLGTTAAAICYPNQAVDITLAKYDRLKVFIKEQWHSFNQMRAEQAASKEVESSVEETESPKNHDKPAEHVAEEAIVGLNENQDEGSDKQEEKHVPKQEAVVEEKPETSFWSNIPFLDKFIGNKESVSSSDVNPVTTSKGENVSGTKPIKDQVIVQEELTTQAKIEGDIGQSNPEDKDMYSTRS